MSTPSSHSAADEIVRSLKEAEGGAWSEAELMELTALSRELIRLRRKEFRLVYWTDAAGKTFYPRWQFDSSFQVLSAVEEITLLLGTQDTLRVLTTFLVPWIGEPGVSPLTLIRLGKHAEAVTAVKSLTNEH